MTRLRPAISSIFMTRWRAVPVMGLVQILTWATMFYPPALTVPQIAAEHGWTFAFTMSGFSASLFAGGLAAPTIGRLIDRFGGNVVMASGSLVAAIGFVVLTVVEHPIAYFATWTVLGIAMAASLYDPAFASLGRIFGAAARRPITFVTFAGGFASTVSWPATLFLLDAIGWRSTYLAYAAVLAFVSAPLLLFALPREQFDPHALPPAGQPVVAAPVLLPKGFVFFALVAAYTLYAFVPSGLAANLIPLFKRGGIDAGTAVAIGALFGPAQVLIRMGEFIFGSNVHPLNIARGALTLLLCAFVILLSAGVSVASAAVFAIMFGMANGLMTLTRGTVPLALFGPKGYGQIMGRIAGPALVMQSAAPFVLAFVSDRFSDAGVLMVVAFIGCVSLSAFLLVKRPRA
jgi:MFS family permease